MKCFYILPSFVILYDVSVNKGYALLCYVMVNGTEVLLVFDSIELCRWNFDNPPNSWNLDMRKNVFIYFSQNVYPEYLEQLSIRLSSLNKQVYLINCVDKKMKQKRQIITFL